ncbi:hypothetical protein G6F46_002529 [Rhizopus delemar]|nr:hypothetical protein G6F55_006385 [Rhizopus delemar]KAG1550601.1 hypothetical protein G6F51_002344 [Rhizopus arrhizus]KAG1498821.1 hypothetical protein G6F54_004807 [Rhizopus delemar]KAG1506861.1 hypothetical protein G6F52_011780 [Rhizopus delemar]KAG1514447.1 hypothetical protein G6F53_003661 [Rhizopus delemar]
MNTFFLYKDGQGHAVDERNYLDPMDYVVDEELSAFQTVSSEAAYLHSASRKHNHETVTAHMNKPEDGDVHMG